jgi:DNA-directed RNA polymerase subunit RPC12/RpoP
VQEQIRYCMDNAASGGKCYVMALPLGPSTRLSDHPEALVELRCRVCGHGREVRVEALARVIGWDAPLAQRLERFRCSRCGARRVEIRFGYERKPRGWVRNS